MFNGVVEHSGVTDPRTIDVQIPMSEQYRVQEPSSGPAPMQTDRQPATGSHTKFAEDVMRLCQGPVVPLWSTIIKYRALRVFDVSCFVVRAGTPQMHTLMLRS